MKIKILLSLVIVLFLSINCFGEKKDLKDDLRINNSSKFEALKELNKLEKKYIKEKDYTKLFNIGLQYIQLKDKQKSLKIIRIIEKNKKYESHLAFLNGYYSLRFISINKALKYFKKAKKLGFKYKDLDGFIAKLSIAGKRNDIKSVPQFYHTLITVIILLLSIIFHEVMHAWTAFKLGDRTAYEAGRITINPIPHIDFFGTIILPIILIVTQAGFLFGWAKPVPINLNNLKKGRLGELTVSLAGPFSNILLGAFFFIIFKVVNADNMLFNFFCYQGMFINVVLAFINLIPIPPLDGSAVIISILPEKLAEKYRSIGMFGFLILILVINRPEFYTIFNNIWFMIEKNFIF